VKAGARAAISPVIATVIIVAVAIAISIAVAGWILGLWSGFGQTESLKIYPDSYAAYTQTDTTVTGYLVLHIQNVGGSPAQIYKIEVANNVIDANSGNVVALLETEPAPEDLPGLTYGSLPVTINSGQEAYLVVMVDDVAFASGTAYTVTIYTETGNVYTTVVYGKGLIP